MRTIRLFKKNENMRFLIKDKDFKRDCYVMIYFPFADSINFFFNYYCFVHSKLFQETYCFLVFL